MDERGAPQDAGSAIRDWLIDEAAFLEHFGLVVDELCARMIAAGVPIARATTHIRVVHSERIGITRVWRRGRETEEQFFGFGTEVDAMYQRSPIRVVHDTRRRIELRPADPDPQELALAVDLRAAGVTHYLMFPLFFSGGQINAASFATDRPGGFLPSEVALIEGVMPALSRVMEIMGLRRSRRDLLRIYVGAQPARRILDGQIRRGDVIDMKAAILFCDLRRSTELSVELEEAAYVETLNNYFDCIVPAVTGGGGDVLKFIGDAVLAIWELPEGVVDASLCGGALAATGKIFAALRKLNASEPKSGPLEIGIALHEGRVAFGNVGSVERQDFTVVGQDVNLASRICSLAAQLGEPLLISERFAETARVGLRKVGEFPLKGFAEPQNVYAPATERASGPA